MKKQSIVLYFRRLNYTKLNIFAQVIHDSVQGKPLLYPSPVPSLSVFQSSIDTMSQARERWGIKGNHGGTVERGALLQARDVVRGHLKSYARYAMTAQPDNPQAWSELGFPLSKDPAKTGRMEEVQNFRQFIARNIPQELIKLKWTRPLGAPAGTMITYMIYRSADEHFANATLVGTTMNKATFMDTPPTAGVLFYYWVIPVTSAGAGARSKGTTAFSSPV